MKIRRAFADELPHLQDIENASGEPFRAIGMPEIADDDPISLSLLAASEVWVAVDSDDVPVAFVALGVVDGVRHIHQVSVHPGHARRGIGAALISHVAEGPVSLTTFRDVPWNAPYYARLGFVEMDVLGPELAAVMAEEAAHGLTGRVAMLLTPPRD
ncbi:GCN5 family N-acetyltransferase [Lentzea sp. NBRC 105346]|uniref:GNAT family N-acetyltransferase n=1 Tax=Lentzea sp. NBRC 105346 TaxID=3032205 RepID=UPI0024A446FB|nr:GNAT family N-acetyltransferase [Lentzea sp. NBRC 105346]GLZ33708.1 GCN5 family N-acetyltransferase [Lentzea sp. NBRC 105346]